MWRVYFFLNKIKDCESWVECYRVRIEEDSRGEEEREDGRRR